MNSSSKYYSRFCAALLLGVIASPLAALSELVVESGPGRAGPLSWQSVELVYSLPSTAGSGWSASLSDLRFRHGTDPGVFLSLLRIDCPTDAAPADASRLEAGPGGLLDCPAGQLRWQTPEGQAGHAELHLEGGSASLAFELITATTALSGAWSFTANELERLALELDAFDLSQTLPWVPESTGLELLYGELSARLTLESGEISGQWRLAGGGFDGRDGQIAGDGLALAGSLRGRLGSDRQELELNLVQEAGELLLGSLYLPAPKAPIEVDLEIERDFAGDIRVQRLDYTHPGVSRLQASARLGHRDGQWRVIEADITELEADLERAWPRWIDGLAASAGFAGLSAKGRLSARVHQIEGELKGLELLIQDFELDDPRERFAVGRTRARLHREASGLQLEMDLDGLMFYGLPFGSGRVRASATDRFWVLQEPLRLPLLEGAVVIDRFRFDPDRDSRAVTLDARIEPLSLEQLTRTLGWPEFGGELSGDFPGVEFRDDRLDVAGEISVNAFSGQIRLSDLVIERPLGSLPALATQVEVSRLDLLELTGAFNFGRMEGELSGWMRDLRLLDWRPVAMDTRLYTHEDAPRRRISQRAVDNLSNLGGGFGGALIGNTVLSIFEDFPYRRAGLACRLSNNICYVDGVASHESGGFYIVEGRGLPRLDIIGHRRLVDWPQLLDQLAAATR
jgi:hypothetical protein